MSGEDSGNDKSSSVRIPGYDPNDQYHMRVKTYDVAAMSLQREQLIDKVHKEDNVAIKVDTIADLTSNISSALEIMGQRNQEKYEIFMDEIKKLRDYFVADLERISSGMDTIAERLEVLATKEEIRQNQNEMRQNQNEMRQNFSAIRKQLNVLLGQQQPK